MNQDCNDIPVVYEWEVCNNENQTIHMDLSESIYKLNNKDIGKIDTPLEPKRCANYKKVVYINSCRKSRRRPCKYFCMRSFILYKPNKRMENLISIARRSCCNLAVRQQYSY